MVICYHYIFLCDSADKGWQSLHLQDKQIGSILTKIEAKLPDGSSSGSGNGGEGSGGFNGCRHCSSMMHTVAKSGARGSR